MKYLRSLGSYIRAIPFILMFQLISGSLLMLAVSVLKRVAAFALEASGRVAVTTGDFMFLFTTWQGWLLIVLALATLHLYLVVEPLGFTAYANYWSRNERTTVRQVLTDAVRASRRFFSLPGILVIVYVSLLAPIVGIGASISLTENLYVPSFIMSVVEATPLYHALYLAVILVFSIVGILGTFCLQGIVVDDLKVSDAYVRSAKLVRQHWLHLLGQMLLFEVLVFLLGMLVSFVIPFAVDVAVALLYPGATDRFDGILLRWLVVISLALMVALGPSLTTLKLTQLYRKYTTGECEIVGVKGKSGLLPFTITVILLYLLAVPLTYVCDASFDELFPVGKEVGVIAHRACGNEGPENCVAGLNVAVEKDAWGAEIDIQRTKDGYYIVNHDDNFKRIAGDSRIPSEMTLEEVKQLIIRNADGTSTGQPISTYEEMLEGSRDRLVLFVELKGKTADRQMADDAIRIARERGMLDQCVFISLKYDIIDYIETNYEDVQTGFLEFAAYGDTARLKCDYLAVEEEVATTEVIEAVHNQDKKVLVWTANSKNSQVHFLAGKADAIITDELTQANEVRAELAQRDDVARADDQLFDALLS